jgi:hypothetical protein
MININCGVEEPTRGYVDARENSIKEIALLFWVDTIVPFITLASKKNL